MRKEIGRVAEGVVNVDEKLERFRQDVDERFAEVKTLVKVSYAESGFWRERRDWRRASAVRLRRCSCGSRDLVLRWRDMCTMAMRREG